MKGKLFQRFTHHLCCSVVSLGGKTVVEAWHGIHLPNKKTMKYSAHSKLLCELLKLSKLNAFILLRYLTNTAGDISSKTNTWPISKLILIFLNMYCTDTTQCWSLGSSIILLCSKYSFSPYIYKSFEIQLELNLCPLLETKIFAQLMYILGFMLHVM